jgi:type I restriction-modification system DNA methylase subunit
MQRSGKALWREIAKRMDEHAYMSGSRRSAERIKRSGEVFTPTLLVIEMTKNIYRGMGPGKTVIDPACGDGQFLVAAKWVKVLYFGMTEEDALKDIYGVDIMLDNVRICRRRLGGGNIIHGDTLSPGLRIPGQPLKDHKDMIRLFGNHIDPKKLAA